ncbi:hypothetical protein TNCV_2003711 [Trichonephila clavipes]|nr:hypothetical protein TNCV_2003711 [Trichonephila clavipes]
MGNEAVFMVQRLWPLPGMLSPLFTLMFWPQYPSGQDHRLVAKCHEFEPSAVEDSPCREGCCALNQSRLKRPPVGRAWRVSVRHFIAHMLSGFVGSYREPLPLHEWFVERAPYCGRWCTPPVGTSPKISFLGSHLFIPPLDGREGCFTVMKFRALGVISFKGLVATSREREDLV